MAQTLTLTNGPEHIDHKAASGDAGYNGLTARLLVNSTDAGEPAHPVFLPLVSK